MFMNRFFRDRRGNVAPIFAIAIIPVVGLTGAAVDYSRAASARTQLQSAIDSTALMLAKEASTLTPEQLNAKGGVYFKALFKGNEMKLEPPPSATSTVTFDPSKGLYTVKVTASAALDTTFTRVLGVNQIDIGSTGEVVWGMKRLELALALDNTGSMSSSNKMTELKTATKSLLNTLYKAAKKEGDVKVAIIPFATDVNIGTDNVSATWLDWTDWEAPPLNSMPSQTVGPGADCPYSRSSNGFKCVKSPVHEPECNTGDDGECINTIRSNGNYAGYICPSYDSGNVDSAKKGRYYNGCYNSVEKPEAQWLTSSGSNASCNNKPNCTCTGNGNNKSCKQKTYTHAWRPVGTPAATPHSTWNGCVWDRSQPYDVDDTAPSSPSTMFQPHQVASCPVSMIGLTDIFTNNAWVEGDDLPANSNNPSSVLGKKVKEMAPVGNTNVTIGMEWGWHALTKSEPLTSASDPKPGELDKVVILLTDGDNTQNRWGNNDIDGRTRLACTKAKEKDIKIYAIKVINGNEALLRECATSPSMFYNVENASQLNTVFNSIAQNLANLRISK